MSILKRKLPGALLLAPLLFAGCYPDTPDSLDEYDLVYTNHSPDFDFQAAQTYAVPDSVVKLEGDLAEGALPDMVDPVYGNLIINQIKENMNARGWTEVAATENPDVIILPSAIKTVNVEAYYYGGGYWGWYYPYYGYGWYYPGYYPTYTTYTTGSLILQMNVPDEPSGADNIPVVWVSIINGLLEGSEASVLARIDTNIDQAFAQSDYLKK